MIDYKVELDRIMKIESEGNSCPPENKLQFLGNYIFNFTTYDSYIDELFAYKMIEVIECILYGTTFKYQENRDNYLNYLTMVNMPSLKDKIEWGSSIRGAWFDEYGHYSEPEPKVYGIGCVYYFTVPKKDIKRFIAELIEWSKI